MAYQAELIIEADDILIGDIEKEPFLFNKHTCTGDGCSSCSFKRNWFLGKVQGCECNSANGSCNHSISNEGGLLTKLINFFI